MPSNRKHSQLGSVVLSFPDPMKAGEPISWEDYKALTGVDLNDIFVIYQVGVRWKIGFNPRLTKDIFFKTPDILSNVDVIPYLNNISKAVMTTVVDEDISSAMMFVEIVNNLNDEYGYMVYFYANKYVSFVEM